MFELNTCWSINKLNNKRRAFLFFLFKKKKSSAFLFLSIASAFSPVRAFYQGFCEHIGYNNSLYSVAQGCFLFLLINSIGPILWVLIFLLFINLKRLILQFYLIHLIHQLDKAYSSILLLSSHLFSLFTVSI